MRDKLEEQSTWNAIDAMKALEVRLAAAEAREARLRLALAEAIDAIEKPEEMDGRMCCSGYECGCYGSSKRDFLLWNLRAAIEENQRVG